MTPEIQNRTAESLQEISLEKWGTQLMENILLAAAEAIAERKDRADSVEVTLTFRLTPIVSSDQLQVSVAFAKDPTLVTYIPRRT
ncbi:MAG: hypothetical protein JO166_16015 [Deltaproteobacteria bacterium]|nr:hypothetical protein [Deltaproteobacteria bacterium]